MHFASDGDFQTSMYLSPVKQSKLAIEHIKKVTNPEHLCANTPLRSQKGYRAPLWKEVKRMAKGHPGLEFAIAQKNVHGANKIIDYECDFDIII